MNDRIGFFVKADRLPADTPYQGLRRSKSGLSSHTFPLIRRP
jgi:hypothetical protein